MRTELLRVGIAALVVNFLLLAVFLRALVAPLYLLAANALTVAATLGITTWFFQDALDQGQLVYYVPFATSVLLLALGSDYNIYLVGGIWRAARRTGIVQGIRRAMPAASRGISVAGLVLAVQLRPAGAGADRGDAPVRLRHGAGRRRSTPSSCAPCWCPP